MTKKYLKYGLIVVILLSTIVLLTGCGAEESENEPKVTKEIDESAWVDDETMKFAQVEGWKLDDSNGYNFYRLENPDIMIDEEIATITIIPYKRVDGGTSQDAINQHIKRSSDVKQESNVTINGIEYLVASENSVFGTTYIFLFTKHEACEENEIADISIVNATLEDAMPVLETISFKK